METKENPLVSVIVPIYKVQEYLPQCLDSILNQSYSNLEVILVDDGSPDRCPEICDEYSNKDRRIKVLHKKNGGPSDARNCGMEIAAGEFFCFIDSDDIIHPLMVEKLLEAMKSFPSSAISACGYTTFTDSIPLLPKTEYTFTELTYDQYINYPLNVTPWAKLYHKSLFNEIRYPVGKFREDEFTTYRLCDLSDTIAYVDGNFYFYRTRQNSQIHTINEKSIQDATEALFQRADHYYRKNNLQFAYSIRCIGVHYTILASMKNQDRAKMKDIKRKLKSYDISSAGKSTHLRLFIQLHFPRSFNMLRKIFRR